MFAGKCYKAWIARDHFKQKVANIVKDHKGNNLVSEEPYTYDNFLPDDLGRYELEVVCWSS